MAKPRQYKLKDCELCGQELKPKIIKEKLESLSHYADRKFCSPRCFKEASHAARMDRYEMKCQFFEKCENYVTRHNPILKNPTCIDCRAEKVRMAGSISNKKKTAHKAVI